MCDLASLNKGFINFEKKTLLSQTQMVQQFLKEMDKSNARQVEESKLIGAIAKQRIATQHVEAQLSKPLAPSSK